MILLCGDDHVETKHEHQVGDDDEEADHEEDEALENLQPLHCVVEEVLSVRLEEGMMTGAILQPDWGRGQQSAGSYNSILVFFCSEIVATNKDTNDMFGI